MKRDFTPDLALSVGLAPNRFPETREELEKAENALQQELEKLSLDEYERILFDIHGLPGHTPEEPEDTSTVLAALENELESIKLPERCAFDSARALNPEYVDGSRFRLMFLRAENFDAKAAAETIVTHFEVKKKIWGEGEILGREVFLDDFDR